jgi:tetratricopeptide (TPR) repeat protein
MRYQKRPPNALRAIVLSAVVTGTSLAAAGCTGVSPGAYNPGELAASASAGTPASVSAGAPASVNAGHSDVTRVAALVQVGIQEANQKDWLAATTTFLNVLEINPGNVYALYNLGVIDQANGKSTGAIGYYKSALAVSKQYTPAMYNEAILLERPDPQQALSLYQQIVHINPQASTAYLRMAFVQAELGDHSAAQVSYARAIAIDPSLGKYPLPSKGAATVTATPARS